MNSSAPTNEPDAATAGPFPFVRPARHVDARYQPDISECEETGARSGLDYIAHVTCGIWDFSTHLPLPPKRELALDRAARHLSLNVARFDATVEQLDTGQMIRVVVQGGDGAVFHMLKVAGQSLFGAVMSGTPDRVSRADRSLALIAERCAERAGSPSLLWGGYRKRGTNSADTWVPGQVARSSIREWPQEGTGRQTVSEQVTRSCRAALDPADVHFIAVYRQDELLWRADIFDTPALGPLFLRVTPTGRRGGYNQVMRQVILQLGRLTDLLALVDSNELTRLVLDVARGAIYVLPLGDREHYLMGVTLLQPRVERADEKMMALHRELSAAAFRPHGTPVLSGTRVIRRAC